MNTPPEITPEIADAIGLEVGEPLDLKVPEGTIRVVFQPAPVAGARFVREVDSGHTIREILEELAGEGISAFDDPEVQYTVHINDEKIPQNQIDSRVPPDQSILIVKVVPGFTAVAALAGFIGAGLAAIGITGTVATVISFGLAGAIVIGGLVGLNVFLGQALAPKQSEIDGSDDSSPALRLTGGRNENRAYKAVPSYFGDLRVYPPLAARPYTQSAGRNQNLRMAFCWGRGPLDISDLKIGESPFSGFVGSNHALTTIEDENTEVQYFPQDIAETDPGVLLRDDINGTPWFTRTTEAGTTHINTVFLLANGLKRLNENGKHRSHGFRLQVQYRETGSSGGWSTITNTNLNGSSARARFLNYGRTVSAGQYDVRARILRTRVPNAYTPDRGGNGRDVSALYTDLNWVALQSFKPGTPVKLPGMVISSFHLRATEQLKGVVDTFNARVVRKLRTWDSSTGFSEPLASAARNPAWQCLEILTSDDLERPVPTSRIDLEKFKEWADFCDSNNLKCDIAFDRRQGAYEAFQTVARVGRATHAMNGDKHSVVFDDNTTTPRQLFTPRNSHSFSLTKSFPEEVHAFRVRFPNRDQNFRAEEMIVYNDGFDESTATKFVEVEDIIGITDSEQLYKQVRYETLSSRLRPELYTWEAGLDAIVTTRGDVVRVRHDVPLFGTGQGRISELETNMSGDITEITLDDEVQLAWNKTYAIEARHNEDTSFVTAGVDNPAASGTTVSTGTLTFTTPVASGSLAQDDLVAFGESTRVTSDLKIVALEHVDDLMVKVHAVDASPEIFTTLAGETPPEFDPNVTRPLPLESTAPATPRILNVSNEVLDVNNDGTPDIRTTVTVIPGSGSGLNVAPTASFISQWRATVTGTTVTGVATEDEPEWITLPEVSVESGELVIDRVRDQDAIDVRVWGVSPHRIQSENAALVENSQAIGDALPPTNLRIESDYKSDAFGNVPILRFLWDKPTTSTAVEFIGRYRLQNDSWRSFKTHLGQFEVVQAQRGTYEAIVQSRDIGGNLSSELTGTFTYEPNVPVAPLRVTGLELTGQANGTEFGGQDIGLRWRISSSIHDPVEGGSFGGGADSGAQDPYFKDYEVRVFDQETGTLLRTEHPTDPIYEYTYTQNGLDHEAELGTGPARQIRFDVYMRDLNNNLSQPTTIIATNNAPAQITSISFSPTFNSIFIDVDLPTDLDRAGVKVWMSTEDGFTPDDDVNLVHDGNHTPITVEAESATTYYLRVAAYDAFGSTPAELNLSSQFEVETPVLSGDDLVGLAQIGTNQVRNSSYSVDSEWELSVSGTATISGGKLYLTTSGTPVAQGSAIQTYPSPRQYFTDNVDYILGAEVVLSGSPSGDVVLTLSGTSEDYPQALTVPAASITDEPTRFSMVFNSGVVPSDLSLEIASATGGLIGVDRVMLVKESEVEAADDFRSSAFDVYHNLGDSITETSIGEEAVSTPKLAFNLALGERVAARQFEGFHLKTRTVEAENITVSGITFHEIAGETIKAENAEIGAFYASNSVNISPAFDVPTTFTEITGARVTVTDITPRTVVRLESVSNGDSTLVGSPTSTQNQFQTRIQVGDGASPSSWTTIYTSGDTRIPTTGEAASSQLAPRDFPAEYGTKTYRVQARYYNKSDAGDTLTVDDLVFIAERLES